MHVSCFKRIGSIYIYAYFVLISDQQEDFISEKLSENYCKLVKKLVPRKMIAEVDVLEKIDLYLRVLRADV